MSWTSTLSEMIWSCWCQCFPRDYHKYIKYWYRKSYYLYAVFFLSHIFFWYIYFFLKKQHFELTLNHINGLIIMSFINCLFLSIILGKLHHYYISNKWWIVTFAETQIYCTFYNMPQRQAIKYDDTSSVISQL